MSSAASSSALVLLLAFGAAALAVGAEPPESESDPQPGRQQAPPSSAEGGGDTGEVRALSGTSVIGNEEVPKSLYIVPWKNSEIGLSTDLSRDLLDEGIAPVDPNEFERRIQFHEHNQQQ